MSANSDKLVNVEQEQRFCNYIDELEKKIELLTTPL